MTEVIEPYIFGASRWKQRAHLESIDSISSQFAKQGCASVEISLNISALTRQLENVPFRPRLVRARRYALLEELTDLMPRGRWDADLNALFSLDAFADLVTNDAIQQVARTLLGEYRITSALVWASFPCSNEAERIASAQVFHVDQDYLDDLKLFVHLSDTWSDDGPLEYVCGTNHRRVKKIWSSEPIPESDLNPIYPVSQRQLFTGPKGSVFISDNRGIHRDRPPACFHSKLALQVNYSRSQFGSERVYASTRPILSPSWPSFGTWCNAMKADPLAYSLLFRSCSR